MLATAGNPEFTVTQLAKAGARRISVGSSLARAAWGGFLAAAREVAGPGTFGYGATATPFAELNDWMAEA